MTDLPGTLDRARRRGRMVGILVFAAIVTTFTAVCSVEIIIQAWAKPGAQPASGSAPAAGQGR